MNDYYIVYENSPEELGRTVASYLAAGWELHGQPFVYIGAYEDNSPVQEFAQALVHKEVQF